MYTQKEKIKENNSKAVANSIAQKKNQIIQGVGFVDNRPETESIKSLQLMINKTSENVTTHGKGCPCCSGGDTLQKKMATDIPAVESNYITQINNDEGLEHEADVTRTKALQMRSAHQPVAGQANQVTTASSREKELKGASDVPGTAIEVFRETPASVLQLMWVCNCGWGNSDADATCAKCTNDKDQGHQLNDLDPGDENRRNVDQAVVREADQAVNLAVTQYFANAPNEKSEVLRRTWRCHVHTRMGVYDLARNLLAEQGFDLGHNDPHELALQENIFEDPDVIG